MLARKMPIRGEQSHGQERAISGRRRGETERKAEEQMKCHELYTVVRHIQGRVPGGRRRSVAQLKRERGKSGLSKEATTKALKRALPRRG